MYLCASTSLGFRVIATCREHVYYTAANRGIPTRCECYNLCNNDETANWDYTDDDAN